jgi:hypothetical protein
MNDIGPEDLRMSSKMCEKRGLVSMGKTIEHTSLYGTDLSDDENGESMMKRFLNLLHYMELIFQTMRIENP